MRALREARLLLGALVVVPLTRIALAIVPFRVVLRAATRSRRSRSASPLSPERIVRIVDAVARRMPGTSCLPRVLAAAFFLTRHGHPAAIRLGVKPGTTRAAHAWLECDGRALLETPPPGAFVTLST